MSKKILSLMVIAVLVLSLFIPTYAATASISVGSGSGSTGETVSIPVSISGNPGFSSAKMTVEYDSSILELSVLSQGIMKGSANASSGMINHASDSNVTDNGTLFTAVFKIKGNASAGSTDVSVSVDKLNSFNDSTQETERISTSVSSGTITINSSVCSVTVKDSGSVTRVTGISLDKSELAISIKETKKLTASLTPSNATDKKIKWISSDTSVATVSDDGKVTGVKEGSTIITATASDGNYSSSCIVTVSDEVYTDTIISVKGAAADPGKTISVPIEITHNPGFAFARLSVTFDKNDLQLLKIEPGLMKGTQNDSGAAFSHAAIENITSDGVLFTAYFSVNKDVSSDEITVGVTVEEFENSDVNTVPVRCVSGIIQTTSASVDISDTADNIKLDKTDISLIEEYSEKLTVIDLPKEVTEKSLVWESSDPSIAIVDNGLVTAVSEGKAVITVKTASGDYSASCHVTVEKMTELISYISVKGSQSAWTQKSNEQLIFVTDADQDKIQKVCVDGNEISSENFFFDNNGDLVIKPEYLSTLKTGEHTISLMFSGSESKAVFSIKEAPSSKPQTAPQKEEKTEVEPVQEIKPFEPEILEPETPVVICPHTDVIVIGDSQPTCYMEGYSGDSYCYACGEKISGGQLIPRIAHNYQDGYCTMCYEEDPDYVPVISNIPEEDPQESDDKDAEVDPSDGYSAEDDQMIVWGVLFLLVAMVVIIIIMIFKNKKK